MKTKIFDAVMFAFVVVLFFAMVAGFFYVYNGSKLPKSLSVPTHGQLVLAPSPEPSVNPPMDPLLTFLLLPEVGDPITYTEITTDYQGFFTVTVGNLTGTYDWWAKAEQYLANRGVVTLTGEYMTTVEVGLMRTGDANNDNVVDILDFDILLASYGRAWPDPYYDGRADFNKDEVVDSADFSLMRRNFGEAGAER